MNNMNGFPETAADKMTSPNMGDITLDDIKKAVEVLTRMAEFCAGRDTDGDQITDFAEIAAGTDPYDTDTDGDGLSDTMEERLGTDPLVPDLMFGGMASIRKRPKDASIRPAAQESPRA
jgi:hypothetical protein